MYCNIAPDKMAGNIYPQTQTSLMGDANGLHHVGRVFLLILVVDKHKHHYLKILEDLLCCMWTSLHHENHSHMLDKG